MQPTFLDDDEIRRLLDMPSAIGAVREAFLELAEGTGRIPVRTSVVSGRGATLLTMPGVLGRRGVLGAKLVAVAEGNAERGLPTVNALVVLLDHETGVPTAVLDGTWLTALRTGAASGVATDALAVPEASVLAVIGAGVQARTQVEAVRAVRPIVEVRIHSRTRRSAERFADEIEGVEARVAESATEAVAGAHVVVTATDSSSPVVPSDAVGAGTHINAIGAYRPDMAEIPPALVTRCRVVVDQRRAALAEAGDVIGPIRAGRLGADDLVELGSVLAGRAGGRTDPDQITLFKSVGSASQDLAVASLALERSRG